MTKAIVFSGCGALGSAQASMCAKYISKYGTPDAYYGISSGAINSFMFGYFGPLRALEFWYGIKSFSDVFTANYFRLLSADGVFRLNKKLVKAFQSQFQERKFPSVNVNFWTMDTKDGKADRHSINKGDIVSDADDLALASVSIPGVVDSWKGRVDSGFRLLAPLKAAIEDGHSEIVLISGRPLVEPNLRPKLVVPAAAAAYQAVDVALSEILRRDLAELNYKNTILGFKPISTTILAPNHTLGGPLDFSKCREFLREGRAVVV